MRDIEDVRDIGEMGEKAFSYWCSEEGLIANKSEPDKTGWDFLVEFPFNSRNNDEIIDVHVAPYQCKVQIKATDKTGKAIPVKLSNLKRQATDPLPAFFVFIEFDKTTTAQNAYVVHVDNNLISKILKTIHEIEQSDQRNNFNKRTMSIPYETNNIMKNLNGKYLKEILIKHIGDNMEEYIVKKNNHLKTTGYEENSVQVKFELKGEKGIQKLLDLSLGIEQDADIFNTSITKSRFGIVSKEPLITQDKAKLTLSELKPTEGFIKFKERSMSKNIKFKAKLYQSPINKAVPDEIKKIRITTDLFEIISTPHTANANYSFSIDEVIKINIKTYKDTIKLLTLISIPGNKISGELDFDNLPISKVQITGQKQEIDCTLQLRFLEKAYRIASFFEVLDELEISLNELRQNKQDILKLESILFPNNSINAAKFDIHDDTFNTNKETVCIFTHIASIGSHTFGVIFTMKGQNIHIENTTYKIESAKIMLENNFISEKNKKLDIQDVDKEIQLVVSKYDTE